MELRVLLECGEEKSSTAMGMIAQTERKRRKKTVKREEKCGF